MASCNAYRRFLTVEEKNWYGNSKLIPFILKFAKFFRLLDFTLTVGL